MYKYVNKSKKYIYIYKYDTHEASVIDKNSSNEMKQSNITIETEPLTDFNNQISDPMSSNACTCNAMDHRYMYINIYRCNQMYCKIIKQITHISTYI